jgi:formyltetrahydrofolate deformylase
MAKSKVSRLIHFTFQGPDKKGIIGQITIFMFQHEGNIVDIDQRVLEGFLVMNMVVDLKDLSKPWASFLKALDVLVKGELGMSLRWDDVGRRTQKNVALLVSTEAHCAEAIIAAQKAGHLAGKIGVIVGNHPNLKALAKEAGAPFFYVASENKRAHEKNVLELLHQHQTDLVVLARYMQILSPEFVFRYEGRIINIHPSLLPAFPGPRAYHQAFNKGVDYVGVTAHFVTTDLDEGPIICQEAFRVDRVKHTVEDYLKQGRKLEAKALTKAVKLFCADKLSLRRGKVSIGVKK